jgi:hypothetical protein
MMMLRGDGTGHTSGAEQSVEALDNSIEPQFGQLARALDTQFGQLVLIVGAWLSHLV